MKLIGLTGGIASGKSTVAQLLREQGYVVLSADQVAREIVQPGQPALQEIADTFGAALIQPDGTLDRAKLGRLIFANPSLRTQLNAITHPRIAQSAAMKIAALEKDGHSIIFYEVPLLFETNMQGLFHATILVSVPPSLQLQRIQERDQLSPQEALHRVESQMPLQEKIKLATYVLDNTSSIENLKQSLIMIMKLITASPKKS